MKTTPRRTWHGKANCYNMSTSLEQGFAAGSLWSSAAHGDLAETRHLLTKNNVKVNEIGYASLTPIMVATSNGFDDVVQVLLEHNANINHISGDGSKLIHLAAGAPWAKGRNTGATLRHLIEIAKTDPRVDINARVEGGDTPLSIAVRAGTFDALEQLLHSGANPHVQDVNGKTPLFLANWRGELEKSKILVEHMTEDGLNLQDVKGNTAAHEVVLGGYFGGPGIFMGSEHRIQILELMMKRRANMTIANLKQQTPSDAAVQQKREGLATVIDVYTTRLASLEALCMCLHSRLGSESPLSGFDPGIIQMIASYL
jgi:ankyrin repeat protein